MPAPIVLVHGGAHGAWCWSPRLPHLDGPALAVDLPPKSVGGGAHRDTTPPELPKTFVKLLRDRSLQPDDQDVYIENLRATPGDSVDVLAIDAGHDVMISRPKELADIPNRIATTTA